MTMNSTDLNAILTRLLEHPEQLDDVKRTLQGELTKPKRKPRLIYSNFRQDDEDDLFDNVPV